MSTRETVTDDDEGKQVVDANGETVGRVLEVRGGTAYVDPDPGMAETVKSKLGWGEADEETYALDEETIETITDDQIRLGTL